MKYFIKTFGCQQNYADSERIAVAFKNRGMTQTKDVKKANYIIINTCMVRESAENRVYGLVNNLAKLKIKNSKLKIIITGCMVGLAIRDKIGKYLKRLKEIMPQVDEFIPIEEVGFDFAPLRTDKISAWVQYQMAVITFVLIVLFHILAAAKSVDHMKKLLKNVKILKKKAIKI